MSTDQRNTIENEGPLTTQQAFSSQPTELVETTFAETIGLSMHNAVANQQQSQMTTAASVTNACARLLQSQAQPSASNIKDVAPPSITDVPSPLANRDIEPIYVEPQNGQSVPSNKKRKLNIFNFLRRNSDGEKNE
ncbi:RebB family R body protein [Photobacterium chitinilyticum]|uniref:Uncharacterized protein n=1 Tax=Photobacterium chitinilyticum TaxID=2485123 RepID=A0A444JVC1_9GAMM|nr:RebB family R body protein [Photobacterium chitinilyticum]RWX57062.1 hypothetical protein EDI28_03210 [Photobacterium chitinilyticum]